MTHPISMFDLVPEAAFQQARDAKLINARDDGAGLTILNYSDAAMYTPGAWDNPAVRFCRGVIINDTWQIIARPWQKFFNHGQAEAGDLDLNAPVEVTDKMDGSLGIIHLALDGSQRVATRGSFASDQAIHATAALAKMPRLVCLRDVTALVEIVYPGNRIVVDYGDRDELVLLGGVDIATGQYLGPTETARLVEWCGPRTETFPFATLREALAAPQRPGMEGLCVRRLDQNHIVKIKQEEYVRLHKIVTGLSERSVWQHMLEDRPLNDLLDTLPDELHDWTRNVWSDLGTRADEIESSARAAHEEIFDTFGGPFERRDYAEQAKRRGPLTPLLFQILDGRDPRTSIIKGLKPAGDTRAKAITEAVA